MDRMAIAFFVGLLCVGCGPQKKNNDGNLYFVEVKNTKARRTLPDTIAYVGTEKVPVTGRSEGGTLAALQGTWQLLSINDTVIAVTSSIHQGMIPRNDAEEKQDSITTSEIINGQVKTTTITNTRRTGTSATNITPKQGSTYHIPQPPYLSFFGSNETFTGFTGCNKMGGRFVVSGTRNISFKSAAPSTRMVCIGDYNEDTFIDALQKVNTFRRDGEQLLLLQGNKVLLQFTIKQPR